MLGIIVPVLVMWVLAAALDWWDEAGVELEERRRKKRRNRP